MAKVLLAVSLMTLPSCAQPARPTAVSRQADTTTETGGAMRPGLVPVEPSPVSVVTTIAVTTTTAPSVAPTTVRPVVVHAATSTTTVPRVAHTHATTTIPSSIGNPGPAVTPTDDVWARLAQCESGMRNLRNPPYSGYFQFLPSTFRAMGGTGGPADHTYEEQKAVAIRLQARSGWGQWPGCSRKLGLT